MHYVFLQLAGPLFSFRNPLFDICKFGYLVPLHFNHHCMHRRAGDSYGNGLHTGSDFLPFIRHFGFLFHLALLLENGDSARPFKPSIGQ